MHFFRHCGFQRPDIIQKPPDGRLPDLMHKDNLVGRAVFDPGDDIPVLLRVKADLDLFPGIQKKALVNMAMDLFHGRIRIHRLWGKDQRPLKRDADSGGLNRIFTRDGIVFAMGSPCVNLGRLSPFQGGIPGINIQDL